MTTSTTIFINGVASSNNYSRGNSYKITEIACRRNNINEVTTLNLTITGSSIPDANLVYRNKIYYYVGTNRSTADKLWHKFTINKVKVKSDGVFHIEAVTDASSSAGSGAKGSLYDGFGVGEKTEYSGTLTSILVNDGATSGFIDLGVS